MLVCLALAASVATGAVATGNGNQGKSEAWDALPIRELVVFKDGHAFAMHRGRVKTDERGWVVLNRLPTPILGGFWPFTNEPGATLGAAIAGAATVEGERRAVSIPDLLRGNVGARCVVSIGSERVEAKILETLTPEAPPAPGHAGFGATRPVHQASLVLLETESGVRVIPVASIRELEFFDTPELVYSTQEQGHVLTLALDWGDHDPSEAADVGLLYLQKGVRWIPSYKFEIVSPGIARLTLQGTILNELADFENALVQLAIGAPSFTFKDMLDPMGMMETAPALSSFFQTLSAAAPAMAHLLMTQASFDARREATGRDRPQPGGVPEVVGADSSEDFYLFSVEHLSLKRGERMVMHIASGEVEYEDVYTLELPAVPPREAVHGMNPNQQREISDLLLRPMANHTLRMTNTTEHPFTTAPTLILSGGTPLSQGLMPYTSIGGRAEITLAPATDIEVDRSDSEVGREPDAIRWHGSTYARILLEGRVSLTNRKDHPVRMEVVRYLLGDVESATAEARIEKLSLLDGAGFPGRGWDGWRRWWSPPHWWTALNGVSRVTWEFTIEPGEQADLDYKWNYFWR
ncbi:MAG: hypothetical protein EA376_05065 [Phycisphaeraceae bacterium]|nr:MAG: hypothetical protein EA376_05065 [Phycisphaeraceae bacterium]